MRSAMALLILLLVGCVDEATPTSAAGGPSLQEASAPRDPGEGPDLSHVKVGQRYTFRIAEGATQMNLVWEVTQVRVDRVDYRVSTFRNGTALGDAGEASWSVPSPPAAEPHEHDDEVEAAPKVAVHYERIELAGRTWTARRVEAEGTRTWVATSGRVDTFPPLLKQEVGGVVTCVLTRWEEPR